MERLDFVLPDFTRILWGNVNVRKIWEPRINKIKQVWEDVERLRESSLQFVSPEGLIDLSLTMKNLGKVVVPLDRQGYSNSYSSSNVPVEEGKPFLYRVAITTPERSGDWLEVYDRLKYNTRYNEGVGILLGYPNCCIEFFKRVWVDEKFIDTTWEMSFNTTVRPYMTEPEEKYSRLNSTTIEGHNIVNNILLRWAGVRYVSHLPCSFNCVETERIGKENREKIIGCIENGKEIASWMDELLSMPIKWSALHGIAEVITPLFKVVTRTDATGEEYVVKLSGTEPKKIEENKDIWTDNGFTSLKEMEAAHQEIITIAKEEIQGKVIDLGCGNGELLTHFPGITQPCGIDLSPSKIKKAQELFPNGMFHKGSIYDFNWLSDATFEAAIISVNRLNESNLSGTLVKKLRENTRYLIIYSYDSNVDVHWMYETYFSQQWKVKVSSWNVMVLQ
jgi:hypothetical protein